MPLNLVPRGWGILRYLHLSDAFSRPTRVSITHGHSRRIHLASTRYISSPTAKSFRPSVILSRNLINSYATSSSTEEQKEKAKSTKGSKAKKPSSASKAKPKRKKELTEKQKEAKEAEKLRLKIKKLKETALEPPKKLSERVWNLAVQSKMAEVESTNQKGKEAFKAATELAKSLSYEEQERLSAQAESNKAANAAAYDKWIKSYTPLQIKEANAARRSLKKLKDISIPPLHDDRLVKKPRQAYMFFSMERRAYGDFKHMSVTDTSSRIAEEWNGMTDAEKEKYKRQAEEDRERYVREYREVYGQESPSTKSKSKE